MAKSSTFTDEEKAAMKEAAAERRTAAKRGSGSKKAEADRADCLGKIEGMEGTDREIGEALHRIVTTHAPDLAPKTWYGMPAYANADGKIVLFYKYAAKFKMRYAEIGFEERANLDDGDIWPTVFAVTAMNPAVEEKLTELVKRAVG
ncbi:uncharacterized protein YdhG (YjbR/CyaY superfamily) [Nocardioides luteus]|uniref:YdhG-like domain-containing protein n=1 Tax=Nocardioides luteus TaxID=1844 RepID=A0ABQ5SQG7_9ACTN|nr:hypothetical protein [Nocardioides luteus]MDR7312945.1 uncharacterized protein YdhG (YjbR/CyaY superfamily) [Nocardioides luteus]GGR45170.1 hypothetical protein GCM10010197_08540 [Nocardioides luteus]GLJ66006.1 hypothetical protein GCM10017579_00420 [Nocardioides luteus]